MHLQDDAVIVQELPPVTRRVVAAVVKHAFGMAIGTVGALGLGGFAALGAVGIAKQGALNFAGLIGNSYLPGYAPTWTGALIGVAWGFGVGYALGWCLALAHNRLIKFYIWIAATRARLAANRTVLDDLM